MGTFSKSLASCGGYIAGPADVIDYLRIASRSFLFTASAVPAATAAALEAVRICRSDEGPELFRRALDNGEYLHSGLKELGYRVVEPSLLADGTEVITPIVPVVIGDDLAAARLWKALWDEGLYTNVALYPAVAPGNALIRTSVMATHEREHLDRALEIFERVKPPVES
jgi:8-amino-7-oxononanoate synthase